MPSIIAEFIWGSLFPFKLQHLTLLGCTQACIAASINVFVTYFLLPGTYKKDMPWGAISSSMMSGIFTGFSTLCLWNKIANVEDSLKESLTDVATKVDNIESMIKQLIGEDGSIHVANVHTSRINITRSSIRP